MSPLYKAPYQKTLSARPDALRVHRGEKIQGHFGIDYREAFCATRSSEKKINIQQHIRDDINNTDDADPETF